ncbi:transmembrane protein 45B-like, partial [Saccoglossus kowalevskii]
MGTFEGHVLPGIFFFAFGLWYTIKFSRRHILKSSNKNGKNEELSDDGRKWRRLRKLRGQTAEFWEGVLIIAAWIIGVIAELPPTDRFPYRTWAMFDDTDEHNFIWGNKWQHATMYTFFGIYGLAMVLSRTCVTGLLTYEKFFAALAFFVEGLLFYFHVHGRSLFDITVHYMLVTTIFLNTIVMFGELWKRDDPLLPFLTAGFMMIQGTWFWQAAFMLYPPHGTKWDEENHANVMFVSMAYCWHIAAAIFMMAGVYGIVSLCLRAKGIYSVPYSNIDDEDDQPDTTRPFVNQNSDEE